jgi:hypothetical protein
MMQRYWWAQHENEVKIHRVKWEKMGTSKHQGGMGCRDLESFNKVLLVKQFWRVMQNPDSLLARILKAKYFLSGSLLDALLGLRPSYVWRSSHRRAYMACGEWEQIRIWKDQWLPPHLVLSILYPRQGLLEEAHVANTIDQDTRGWNTTLIRKVLREINADIICQIPHGSLNSSDKQIWSATTNEEFSVRSAYHLQMEKIALGKGECSR